ncbi:MAG: hypothetical protein EBS19_15325 [Spirochaetia bacterium]|nr:hypothetical protein [Spirochaetia bacterium]
MQRPLCFGAEYHFQILLLTQSQRVFSRVWAYILKKGQGRGCPFLFCWIKSLNGFLRISI